MKALITAKCFLPDCKDGSIVNRGSHRVSITPCPLCKGTEVIKFEALIEFEQPFGTDKDGNITKR